MEILSPNSARLVSIIRNAFFESNAVKSVELYENSYSEAEEKGVYLNPLHVYLFFRDGILDGVSNLAVTLTFDADMCTECEFTIEGEKANDWRKHTRDVKKFITPGGISYDDLGTKWMQTHQHHCGKAIFPDPDYKWQDSSILNDYIDDLEDALQEAEPVDDEDDFDYDLLYAELERDRRALED